MSRVSGEVDSEQILDDVEEYSYSLPTETRAEGLEARGLSLPVGAVGRAEYLSHAAEFYETHDRLDDALRCLREAIADGGTTWVDVRVRLVRVLLLLGEDDEADNLARELRRSLGSVANIDTVVEWLAEAFEEVGRLREALRWFNLGVRSIDPEVLDDGDDWSLGILNGRSRVRRALGLGHDGYDRARDRVSEGLLERRRRTSGEWGLPEDLGGSAWTLIHWPEPEFQAFAARWPHLAEGYGGTFRQHRIETEQHLRRYASTGLPVSVGMASLEELLAYADEQGLNPTLGSTRAAYAAGIGRSGRAVPWPPERNDACWCGSSLTYRACCRRHPDAPSGDDEL